MTPITFIRGVRRQITASGAGRFGLAPMQPRLEGRCHIHTRSEEFRAQAAECKELADRSYELIKEQYEELTRQWLFLAEHAKAHEVLSQFAAAWRNINFLPTGRRRSSFASLPFTRIEL